MADQDERPMWSGELGDELIACMVKNGTASGDREKMFQICSILMIAILRGELIKGASMKDLDRAINQIADLHHRSLRDFTIAEGTIVLPDDTIGTAVAVMPDEHKSP